MKPKIVIIGAGATGLGAAYRMKEIGFHHWKIYERNPYIGGLAASHRNGKDFMWDGGAHAIYSKYEYVNRLLDKLLGDEYILHKRNTWVWALNQWVPYPFQNNIRYLPRENIVECLLGLFNAQNLKQNLSQTPENFEQWIMSTFGAGIARYFMLPYNRKLWAYPLDRMDMDWLSQRVSLVNMKRLIENLVHQKTDTEWGDNVEFKIPLKGGTGGLFNKLISSIGDHLILEEEMVKVDTKNRTVTFRSGVKCQYDVLLNTIPLDLLIKKITPRPDSIREAADRLKHNSLICVGVGMKGPCPTDKTWIYFPERDCCFHRVSYLSNYSPDSVPDLERYHSLICETSYSKHKAVDKDRIVEESIQGLMNTGLIDRAQKESIETTHVSQIEYAYPIPTLETPRALRTVLSYLEGKGIYSRGRFGAWSYKSGNMDHAIMQGVETVNKVIPPQLS